MSIGIEKHISWLWLQVLLALLPIKTSMKVFFKCSIPIFGKYEKKIKYEN
jgi:hypothetical protein